MLGIGVQYLQRANPDRPKVFLEVVKARREELQFSGFPLTELEAVYVHPLVEASTSSSKFIIYVNNLKTLATLYDTIETYLEAAMLVDETLPESLSNLAVVNYCSVRTSADAEIVARRLRDPASGLLGVVASSALGMGCARFL